MRRMVAAFAVTGLCAAAASGPGGAVAASAADESSVLASASAGKRAAREFIIRRCVNRYRADAGLAPLDLDRDLARAARLHAKNMRSWDFYDHVDPLGRDPADRVALFTDRFGVGVGENIFAGPPAARAACEGWMRSAGHRANILDPDYTHIGTGFAAGGRWGRYYVQVFGLPPAESEDEGS